MINSEVLSMMLICQFPNVECNAVTYQKHDLVWLWKDYMKGIEFKISGGREDVRFL